MPHDYPEPKEQAVPEGWLERGKMEWEFKCPDGWEVIQRWGDGHACRQKHGGLRVIIDCEVKADGLRWLHVSASRSGYTPTHNDMSFVKRDFIGGDLYAYSVWPPSDKHVNLHNYCLHLWACLDKENGKYLPEFSAVIDGIGASI